MIIQSITCVYCPLYLAVYNITKQGVKMSTTIYKTKKCDVLDSIVYKTSKYKNNKKIKMYTIQGTSFQIIVFQTRNNALYARSVKNFTYQNT